MRASPLFLGIDVGTTSVKAVVYDPHLGRVRRKASQPTPTRTLRPGEAEWDADGLWDAVVRTVRAALSDPRDAARVRGIGIASVGEAGLPVDARGRALYPIIAWFDRRGEEFVPAWERDHDLAALYLLTGHMPRSIYTAFKLLWLQRHHPHVLRRAYRWLFVGDYVAFRLTGLMATVPTLAARSYLFDVVRRRWVDALVREVGLRGDQMPPVVETESPVGYLQPEAAEALGLTAGIPVALGGHDHVVGMWVGGITLPGRAVDSSGTAQGVAVLIPEFVGRAGYEAHLTCYPFVVGRGYILQGGMPTAGAALQWLADLIAGGDVARVLAWAEAAPPGSRDVVCLPFLRGVGSPYGRSDVRALFAHLDLDVGREEVARALVEGLACFLAEIVRLQEEVTGRPVGEIRAIGGANRSPFLLRVKASMTGRPVVRVDVEEAVGTAAALLAGLAAGYFASPEEALAGLHVEETRVQPEPAWAEAYRRVLGRYRAWLAATLNVSGA